MSNKVLVCPECVGTITVPFDFTGKLNCLRCGKLVFVRDEVTKITWVIDQPKTQESSPENSKHAR